jgi:hypothetical protein
VFIAWKELSQAKPLNIKNIAKNLYFKCSFQYFIVFDVHKSVHHYTIQLNQPTRCNSFTSLLLDIYVWLNMFRVSPRPSSGVYNCASSLWFYRWRVAFAALLVVVWPVASCWLIYLNFIVFFGHLFKFHT